MHKVRSLTEQVYDRLRVDIVTGRLQPDDRLVELDIAATMGTSQAPVREALQRLEREGLVKRRGRSGTYVTGWVLDEMYELFAIRSTIEGFAAKRTARTIKADQLSELETLIELMRTAANDNDMALLTEYDLLFHRDICEWSGSSGLMLTWEPLYSQVQRFVVQTNVNHFNSLHEIAESHLPVIEALRQGNEAEAVTAIQEHVMLIWSKMGPEEIQEPRGETHVGE
jgi:DNA-binding GntR family transcriptional regulator